MLNLEVDLAQQVINMIIFLIFLILIVVSIVGVFLYKRYFKNDTKMSFRESLDLTELPVVTFYSGNKKFNMLLDTGSSECVISKEYLNEIWYKETDKKKEMFGMEGEVVINPIISTIISYSGLKFDVEFLAADMTQAFNLVKQESGVTIHGILGSNFFTRYKYVLDFDKLMFYKK